jgi:predicted RNase H-like HicB family nuclease
MATSYIALLRKEAGSDYGVEFPDFPGCVTAGKTIDEAARMATEALELHLKGLVEDGEPIPAPSALDVILASDWETKGAIPLLVTAKEPGEKVLRVNVTFKPLVLRALDGYASEHHLTRAAALERAVTKVVGRTVRSKNRSLDVGSIVPSKTGAGSSSTRVRRRAARKRLK